MLRIISWVRAITALALVALALLFILTPVRLGSILALAARPLSQRFALQATSQIIFVSTRDGNKEIYIMDADGGNPHRLTNNTAVDDHPVWSPDQTKIAFASQRDGGDWEIYVMDANGGNQTRLTTSLSTDFLPSWSPDGSKLAFASDRFGQLEIFSMNADGSNQTRLTDASNPDNPDNPWTDEQPTWAPDGVHIAFASDRDGDYEIYIMDSDGNNVMPLTDNPAVDYRPIYSPNGSKLAFSTNRDGNYEIYVMDANGANPVNLTSHEGDDFRPAWSADAAKIAFFTNRDGNFKIYAMNANGENQVKLSGNTGEDINPDWSPPGGSPPTPPPVCGGVYPANADTYVDEAQASSNFGDDNELHVGKGAGNEKRTLLNFTLDNIPPSSSFQQAYVEVTLAHQPEVVPYSIAVYDLPAWDENSVTWASQPATGTSYSAINYTVVTDVVRIDVTTLATRWANGEISPTTLLLRAGEGEDYNIAFVSSEAAPAAAPTLYLVCGTPVVEMPSEPPVPPDQQAAAISQIEAASSETTTLYLDGDTVSFASFVLPVPTDVLSDTAAQAQWFLDEHSAVLGVKDGQEFQIIRQSDDGNTIFFRQRHAGIPILGAEIALHVDDGSITGFNGNYVTGVSLPTNPQIAKERAEELALAGSSGDGVGGDTQLRYVDLSLLGVENGAKYLTWQVNVIQSATQAKIETVYVDAFTGAAVFRYPAFAYDYDLDLENGQNELSTDLCDIWDDDDIDGDDFLPDSQLASDNFGRVYGYWSNAFGRDSYDDDGEQIEVDINTRFSGGLNASYSTGCDIFFFALGTPTQDITGHEFTHAVIANEANLIYANQPGALNESFADIFGYFTDPSSFLIGEGSSLARAPNAGVAGCSPTQALRDMNNPTCFGNPNHVTAAISGDGVGLVPAVADPNAGNDFGSVHNNSGIHNKVAALIISGGVYNTYALGPFADNKGIGIPKAQRLFYGMLVHQLNGSAQFIDARNGAIAEATSLVRDKLFGFTDADVCTVRKAYAAVGIGFADRDCDGIDDTTQPNLDTDKDGVADATDNCLNKYNPSQSDLDSDGQGDACDPDVDSDGAANNADNCPWVANAGQADWNGDGEGDACGDADGDGRIDNADNCRAIYNPGQEDLDHDGIGDVCDPDIDNDAWLNEADNCPVNANPGQEDTTEIAVGLAADHVGDVCDHCPFVSSSDNGDPDNDGLGNPCDSDDDNDSVLDESDNCPLVANTDQLDWDKNGIGYVCDENERIQFGVVLKRYNDNYVRVDNTPKIPIPVCPECGDPYLPRLWETQLQVVLPVEFKASVVDSNGVVVAKSVESGLTQSLKFNPAPFAISHQLASTANVEEGNALLADVEAADELHYYLRIDPIPGTDLSQAYPMDLSFEEKVEEAAKSMIYLPLTGR